MSNNHICEIIAGLRRAAAIIEALPETGAALYDDQIADIFNALDNLATGSLTEGCAKEEVIG